MSSPKFDELLCRHVASSTLKQMNLDDFLGKHKWLVDLEKGHVDFGRGRIYPIQLLGSESYESGTWLWGWANEQSDIPANLLVCANRLREMGEAEAIEEFSSPQFPFEVADGHKLALIATGICGADCYYSGPYGEGALLFTISGVPFPKPGPADPRRLISAITDVISVYRLDHKLMVRSFFQQQGYEITGDDEMVATRPTEASVTITFDDEGHIEGLGTTLPTEESPRKPWWRFGKSA